jgi:GDPmannose 4,6-dehydratase
MRALIFGITGQDGSYLAELLLEKQYEVYGVIRRSSSSNTKRIDHIKERIHLIYGDLTDSSSILLAINSTQPDEIYNLAAMSHVGVSFNLEKYTTEVDALGTLYILQAIRNLGLEKQVKFYQASTSEMFGNTMNTCHIDKLTMSSPMYPCSPYAIAKLYAHHMCAHYRKAYNMFVVSNVLMNHESPRRGDNFVTQKIIMWAKRWQQGLHDPLQLGNFTSTRDWGHAKDYVYGIWLTLQQTQPKDYLLATGVQTSIKQFIEMVLNKLNLSYEFVGQDQDEKCFIIQDNNERKLAIYLDPQYKRPNELTDLRGDPTEAEQQLGWIRQYDLDALIDDMLEHCDV